MSWKDNLLQGSFRGIPFHVDSHEYKGGRRSSIFELIGEKDIIPVVEDSGPEIPGFTFDAYIIQQDGNDLDYFPVRDDLIKALNKVGPGLLIHPYLGEKTVRVFGEYSMSETWKEGGLARFSITFVETKDPEPKGTSDSDSNIDDQVDNTNDIAQDNFQDQYEEGNFQEVASNSIIAGLENMTQQMYAMNNVINKVIYEAVAAVAGFIQLVDDLLDAPCDIANGLINAGNKFLNLVGLGAETITGGIIGGCSGVIRNAQTFDGSYVTQDMGKKSVKALTTSIEFDPVEDVYVPEEQLKNTALIKDTMAVFLIGVGCKILIRTEFESQETLIEYMNKFVESIDYILDRMGDEGGVESIDYIGDEGGVESTNAIDGYKTGDLFNAVQDLRNVFVNEMLIKNTEIPETNEYKVGPGTISALQLAYDLYEDLDRMEDIFNRNKATIAHPGFLPGGEKLKVLSE